MERVKFIAGRRGNGRMARKLIFLTCLLSLPAGSFAQSLQELDQREAALMETWEKMPLSVRRAVFEKQRAEGFGMYQERPSNVFKPGEKLIAYVEPVGYGWKEAVAPARSSSASMSIF